MARRKHPSDRRATLVTLTEAGMKIGESWDSGYRQFASDLFEDSPDEDVETFLNALKRIVERLRPAGSTS